jgi:CheY-like chemotaxis protein
VDAKPCILLVDDEADFRFSASVALRKAGCEVVEAADGNEAISRFQEFRRAGKRFELLLTDLRMPFLCGLELLEALRELGSDIPVIAVTGYSDDALRTDLMRKGCTEILEKPFEPGDLVNRVQKILENFALQGGGI